MFRRRNTCAAAFLALAGTMFHTPKATEDAPIRPLPHHGPLGPRLKKKRHRKPPSTPPIPSSTTSTTEPVVTTTTTSPPTSSLEQQVIDGPTFTCIRRVESDNHYAWSWNPYGTGNGGGAFQFEPSTYAEGAAWAGISPYDHSEAAQNAVAFAIWQHLGYTPWNDGCE